MGATRTCPSCGDTVVGTLDRCPKDGAALFSDEVMARVGMLLKDHEILGVIGEGGMGVVYRAQHVVIEKAVAIKVLHDRFARQKEMVEQFIIEAKAASRIRHPNIIDVTDFGTTPDGLVFLVMEYLDGESLEERLQRVRRLPVFEAVNIAGQIARGLGAAHELGIVHRDLKPANIFLCEREGRRRIVRRTTPAIGTRFTVEPEVTFDLVKLLDFGVAKFMDLGPSAATRMGVLCGTPQYLSPEQAKEKPATERSDIYALGAVLYEMVTGVVPFEGSSMLEILSGHVSGVVRSPSRRAPDAGIPPRLDEVIAKCLEKDPGKRFANAEELDAALVECVTDRAFLRDAHRLPGIAQSGIDLADGRPSARGAAPADAAAPAPAAPVPAASDARQAEAPPADWNDRLDDDPRLPDDILGFRRARTYRVVGLAAGAVVLLAGVGGALWLRGGTDSGAPSAAAIATTAAAPAAAAPALPVSPAAPAAKPAVDPSVAPALAAPTGKPATEPVPAKEPVLAAPTDKPSAAAPPVRAPVKNPPLALGPAGGQQKATVPGKAAATRTPVASSRGPSGKPSSSPAVPSSPIPAATGSAASAAFVPEQAAEAESLLRDAQQAWRRRYFALAIDKARAALKADPGRQGAYEIIATSACALGDVADARLAIARLDEAKRRQVRSLCEKDGVRLD